MRHFYKKFYYFTTTFILNSYLWSSPDTVDLFFPLDPPSVAVNSLVAENLESNQTSSDLWAFISTQAVETEEIILNLIFK